MFETRRSLEKNLARHKCRRPKKRMAAIVQAVPRSLPAKLPNHYRVRTQALLAIGFSSYDEYLASPLWAQVKTTILAAAENRCFACQRPVYTVHHITYTVAAMLGKDESQLVAICRACHKAIEFINGEKLLDANSVFKALCRRKKLILGGNSRKNRKDRRPKCRCCGKPPKVLGRDGICLGCYKRYRERVHDVVREREQETIAGHGVPVT